MELIDARPLLQRNPANLWERAAKTRDTLYEDFLRVSREQGIDALVLKTNPAVYPPQVKFEFWLPQKKYESHATDNLCGTSLEGMAWDTQFRKSFIERSQAERVSEGSIMIRCDAIVSIQPKPFHRYELEFTLEIIDHGRSKKIRSLRQFSKQEVVELVCYLLRKGPKPRYFDLRLRRFFSSIGGPKIRFSALRKSTGPRNSQRNYFSPELFPCLLFPQHA